MTKLTPKPHPLTRETVCTYRVGRGHRAIIIDLHPGHMTIRLKGLRSQKFDLAYDSAFQYAAKIKADVERREKAAAKKAKRSV